MIQEKRRCLWPDVTHGGGIPYQRSIFRGVVPKEFLDDGRVGPLGQIGRYASGHHRPQMQPGVVPRPEHRHQMRTRGISPSSHFATVKVIAGSVGAQPSHCLLQIINRGRVVEGRRQPIVHGKRGKPALGE